MGMRSLAAKCEIGFGTILDVVLSNEKERQSLIPAFSANKKLGYGPATSLVIEPPSSGEESEDELLISATDPVTQKMTAQQIADYNALITKCKRTNINLLEAEDKGQPSFKEVIDKLFD